MSDEQNDPSANTAAFQAFVREAASGDPELPRSGRSKLGIIIGVIAAVVIVAAVIVILVAS